MGTGPQYGSIDGCYYNHSSCVLGDNAECIIGFYVELFLSQLPKHIGAAGSGALAETCKINRHDRRPGDAPYFAMSCGCGFGVRPVLASNVSGRRVPRKVFLQRELRAKRAISARLYSTMFSLQCRVKSSWRTFERPTWLWRRWPQGKLLLFADLLLYVAECLPVALRHTSLTTVSIRSIGYRLKYEAVFL